MLWGFELRQNHNRDMKRQVCVEEHLVLFFSEGNIEARGHEATGPKQREVFVHVPHLPDHPWGFCCPLRLAPGQTPAMSTPAPAPKAKVEVRVSRV